MSTGWLLLEGRVLKFWPSQSTGLTNSYLSIISLMLGINMFVCCFTSKQHLRSYQNGYWLMTVCSHGDFIVLTYWDTSHQQALWPDIPVTLFWHWANQSLPYPNNAEHLARKRQVPIWYIIGLTRPWVWTHDLLHARSIQPTCLVESSYKLLRYVVYWKVTRQTSLNRPTMGPTSHGPFTEGVSLRS